MTKKQGLWIDGKSVDHTAQDFQSVLKFALVPANLQNRPAFRSDDMAEVMSLVDALDIEISLAMMNDYLSHEFASPSALAANIALRKGVIAAMKALCSGDIDGDYVEAAVGVPPTLGYLRNLEVLYAKGASSGEGILTKDAPFAAPDCSWVHTPDTESWTGFVFVQKPDVPLSKALTDVTPFRGECAGALQLSILTGCLNGLGAEEVDALLASYGPAFIGAWKMPSKDGKTAIRTTASQFMDQLHDVPTDYERGKVIAVPGDYLYFKNKDDYSDRAQMGGWQGDPKDVRRGSWHGGWRGENCIYMGQDALGDPHYSGMGLAWKSEFALRMFLSNAYFTDANCTYLQQRRDGKDPTEKPVIVEDPQRDVRFTRRALIRYPELTGIPPQMRMPTMNPSSLSSSEIRKRLDQLGFQKSDTGVFATHKIKLETVMEALHLNDSDMQQLPSASPGDAGLTVSLSDWSFQIHPVDKAVLFLSSGDLVDIQAIPHQEA